MSPALQWIAVTDALRGLSAVFSEVGHRLQCGDHAPRPPPRLLIGGPHRGRDHPGRHFKGSCFPLRSLTLTPMLRSSPNPSAPPPKKDCGRKQLFGGNHWFVIWGGDPSDDNRKIKEATFQRFVLPSPIPYLDARICCATPSGKQMIAVENKLLV